MIAISGDAEFGDEPIAAKDSRPARVVKAALVARAGWEALTTRGEAESE